jgi:hypothetical protein
MSDLLAEAIAAHGGLNRWGQWTNLRATVVSGGQLWGLKGVVQDASPRALTVALHAEQASVRPYGADDQRTSFTPDRIAVEKLDGRVVAERSDPRASFLGHELSTPWDALDRAYFGGYALWTYLTTPFLLAMPGFTVEEIEPWVEGEESWYGLRATFPTGIASHSPHQDFFFGADHLLRRHDYHVDIAGGFAAAQYVADIVDVDGIRFPTRRRAYRRGPDRRPLLDQLMVSIDVSDIELS